MPLASAPGARSGIGGLVVGVAAAGGHHGAAIAVPSARHGVPGALLRRLIVARTCASGLVIFRRPRFDALARRARPAIDRAQGGWYGAALIAAFGIYLIYRGLQG
jgi:hypothetical protein